jgi:hypothetical protein
MHEWIACGLVTYGLMHATYHFMPPEAKTHEFWTFQDCMFWLGVNLIAWPFVLTAGLLAILAGILEAVHQAMRDHDKN